MLVGLSPCLTFQRSILKWPWQFTIEVDREKSWNNFCEFSTLIKNTMMVLMITFFFINIDWNDWILGSGQLRWHWCDSGERGCTGLLHPENIHSPGELTSSSRWYVVSFSASFPNPFSKSSGLGKLNFPHHRQDDMVQTA